MHLNFKLKNGLTNRLALRGLAFMLSFADYYRKAGSVDRWFGMTTSLARGFRYTREAEGKKLKVSSRLTQWQVGLYHKADIWVTNDRYMGPNPYWRAEESGTMETYRRF